jgi:hypothetical protein
MKETKDSSKGWTTPVTSFPSGDSFGGEEGKSTILVVVLEIAVTPLKVETTSR